MQDKAVSQADLDVLRVRLYRPSDREVVQQLFRTCIVTGAGSPARVSFRWRLNSPSFRCTLLMVILALMISLSYEGIIRIVCLSLSLALVTYLFVLMHASVAGYINFCESSLKDDLNDVAGHYQLLPAQSNGEESIMTNVRGFWVAEMKSAKTGESEVVGCAGLDVSSMHEPGTGELRRMVVSPYHRRRGIATALITTCEVRARKYGLSSIVLSTTEFQPSARKLYAREGYTIVREWGLPSGFTKIRAFDYRKYLV